MGRLPGDLCEDLTLPGYPFDLHREDAYRLWRDEKLAKHAQSPALEQVEIANPYALSVAERDQLITCCRRHNSCLYVFATPPQGDPRDAIIAFGRAIGLHRVDRPSESDVHPVATITIDPQTRTQEYIPYTNQPINWHTDGYYNPPKAQIRGVVMHCVQPAIAGGANTFLDPELVYIKLRDHNREMMAALMTNDAMCIPANLRDGVEVRPMRSGAVFSIDHCTGQLHMRYTARTKSVIWSARAAPAADALKEILATSQSGATTVRLSAHQGIVCNNVLHRRQGFEASSDPDKSRILLRGRYYDRVTANP